MSSSENNPNSTSADLTVLESILETAGMGRHASADHQSMRMRAAACLISIFRQGRGSSATEISDSEPMLADAGGGQPRAAFGSYQFGKRLEADKTWTIVHVFTGNVARYGCWTMKGLTGGSAVRVLRTLNTPQSAI